MDDLSIINKNDFKILESLVRYPRRNSHEKYKFGRKVEHLEKDRVTHLIDNEYISTGMNSNGDMTMSITRWGHFIYGLEKAHMLREDKNPFVKMYGKLYDVFIRPKF